MSTYSDTITEAAYGHPKRDPHLLHITLYLVVDFNTGDVCYVYVANGPVPDSKAFKTVLLAMKADGFNLDKVVIVTDRGFESISNLQSLVNANVGYIVAVPIRETAIREKLLK